MGLSFGIAVTLHALGGLLIATLPVRVSLSSGEELDGILSGLEDAAVSIESDGQSLRIPVDELVSLVPPTPQSATAPAMRVILRDGSQLAAQEVTLEEERLRIQPRRQEALSVPLQRVAAIRFRTGSPATDPRWLGILEQRPRGDLLAIRRDEGRLDPVAGVVEAIADGRVRFALGGDTVHAPIERLEGIVFGGATGEGRSADGLQVVATIHDIYGSEWVVVGWTAGPLVDGMEVRLSGDVTHTIPLDQLASIRFRGGQIALVEQTPAEKGVRPYLESKLDPALLEGWFGPRVNAEGELVMVGGSSVTYRAEPGFRKLLGSVHRDPDVAAAGEVSVRITFDDRVVWEQALLDRDPQGFELELGRAARIRFDVLSGSDGDVGDLVRLSHPRLVK